MGFVGGGRNIAIATALPPSSFVYCIVNIKWFMEFLYLIFYPCLSLRFWMWRLILARGILCLHCRLLCSNVRGLAGNLSDLAVASSQYDIMLCSETLVLYMRQVLELLVPGFGLPVLCRGKIPRARGMAAYVQDGYGAFGPKKIECGCYEMVFFLRFVV